jgi:hypothetical protein
VRAQSLFDGRVDGLIVQERPELLAAEPEVALGHLLVEGWMRGVKHYPDEPGVAFARNSKKLVLVDRAELKRVAPLVPRVELKSLENRPFELVAG